MKIEISSEDALYEYIIRFLQDIKLTMGPQALYSTLRRHKSVQAFLLEYQADHLKSIEGRIADLDK